MHPDDHRRALRDQFFVVSRPKASEEDKQAYRDSVANENGEAIVEIDGLSVSYHPTSRFKALRFLEAKHIDESVRQLFARPILKMPQLAAAFVDPEEFSFRSFENILPLDRLFGEELGIELNEQKKLGASRRASGYAYSLQLSESARGALLGLDDLGLYTEPLNAASRGGKRFIFHCARLAETLTAAVAGALPKGWSKGFSHVNPVFRCNRFEPGDAKFASHVDTPYYDASRKQASKLTMLIYLTGGRGTPALAIDGGVALEQIDPMTCVIFPQHLEHEGTAFEDGDKVFLRTELVYEDHELVHEPRIAQLFAKATYLTGESVFAPELAAHTHELYDRAAKAHWGASPDAPSSEPYIVKRFRGVGFMTNGYDFWFAKGTVSLEECAALALLDVLNCKVAGESFRKQCETEVVELSDSPSELVVKLLGAPARHEPLFAELATDMLFPDLEEDDDQLCCPFHVTGPSAWRPERCSDVVGFYAGAQLFAQHRIDGAPIKVMGQEIFLDPSKFDIVGDKIHVRANQGLAPVNFAACWNDGSVEASHVDVETTVDALQMIVPPIPFRDLGDSYHLMFDFFRNAWMVEHAQQEVPVPRFWHPERDEGEWEDAPWLDAVAAAGLIETDPGPKTPWWATTDDPDIAEGLADREE